MKTYWNRFNRKPRAYDRRHLGTWIGAAAWMFILSTSPAQAQQPSQMPVGAIVKNGQLIHGDQAFQLLDASAVATAGSPATVSNDDPTEPPILGSSVGVVPTSCNTCNSGSSIGYPSMTSHSMSNHGGMRRRGGCRSCGRLCGGSCDYIPANPCQPCEPFVYGLFEALYMEREDVDNFTTSPDFSLGEFDHEWAGRVTIGRVPDCVHGCEFSYTNEVDWDTFASASDPVGFGIGTVLTAGAPLFPTSVTAFNNASFQSQSYEADYWSVEANRTMVAGRMAKLLYGARYIEYDEQFSYFSQNATETGQLQSLCDNQLFGLHVGMDLLYPISRCGYTDFRARAGAFYNSVDTQFSLTNGPNLEVFNRDEDGELAGVFEVSSGVRYQFGMLSLRAGGELWYLGGIATATDQFGSEIVPTTGAAVNADDDVLFAGLSFGGELRY